MQIVVIAVYLHICFVQCAYAFFSSVILVMFTLKYNLIYAGVLELVFENVISRVHTCVYELIICQESNSELVFPQSAAGRARLSTQSPAHGVWKGTCFTTLSVQLHLAVCSGIITLLNLNFILYQILPGVRIIIANPETKGPLGDSHLGEVSSYCSRNHLWLFMTSCFPDLFCVARSGFIVFITAAVTSRCTAMRPCSLITLTQTWASEILRPYGHVPATWASSAGPNSQMQAEVIMHL